MRVALAVSGGQYFFPDEKRYDRAIEFARLFWSGHLLEAVGYLVERADHMGWVAFGAVPATAQLLLASLTGRPPTDFAYVGAVLLGQASTGCILLLYHIAVRTGASRPEALVAASLLAASTSMLYWSRHLMPYDVALLVGLTGLYVATGPARRAPHVFLAGLLAGLTFMVYNGYWTLSLFVMAAATIINAQSIGRAFGRGALVFSGFLSPVAASLAFAEVYGASTLGHMRTFAGTVKQGDLAEGFSLPFAYLWHTEHGLFLLWIFGAGCYGLSALDTAGRRGGPRLATPRSLLLGDTRHAGTMELVGIAGVLLIYALLAVDSAILRIFVVYGRLVRQIVPFLCMVSAPLLVALWERSRDRHAITWVAGTALAVQLLFNLAAPFQQMFPRDLERQLFAYKPMAHALSVDGPSLEGDSIGHRYVLVNAQYLYPPRSPRALPNGEVVLSVPHPLAYRPYQYEGFRPYERQILQRANIAMWLIARRDADAAPPGMSTSTSP